MFIPVNFHGSLVLLLLISEHLAAVIVCYRLFSGIPKSDSLFPIMKLELSCRCKDSSVVRLKCIGPKVAGSNPHRKDLDTALSFLSVRTSAVDV